MAPPPENRRLLDEMGYVKLDGFIAPARRQRLADRIDALFASEGEQAGAEFRPETGARRLANLSTKETRSSSASSSPASSPTLATSWAPASS